MQHQQVRLRSEKPIDSRRAIVAGIPISFVLDQGMFESHVSCLSLACTYHLFCSDQVQRWCVVPMSQVQEEAGRTREKATGNRDPSHATTIDSPSRSVCDHHAVPQAVLSELDGIEIRKLVVVVACLVVLC